MAYPVAAGRAQYTGNFIPELWAGKLIVNFYDATVLAAISNTDYEGQIKNMGDTVNIRTTPEISILDYVKGQTLEVQTPDKPKIQLLIDKGHYFSCVEDDIDKVQTDIGLMETWTKDASERMKIRVDTLVLEDILPEISPENKGTAAGAISKDINLGSSGYDNSIAVNPSNVLDLIINMGTVLDEANCPESDRFLVIPDKLCGYIKQSDLKSADLTGDSMTPLRNGLMGMIDRFKIYRSHNLLKNTVTSGSNSRTEYNLIAGTKMGFTFASQMTNMETIRAQSTFGNIIRGLQVFGYKVVKPESLLTAVINLPDRSNIATAI